MNKHFPSKFCELLHFDGELPDSEKRKLSKLIFEYQSKWKTVRRNIKFEQKYKKALESSVHFHTPKKRGSTGRPLKNLESSERTKRRKTEQLREKTDSKSLMYAAQMKYRSEGHTETADILRVLTTKPEAAKVYQQAISVRKMHAMSVDKALSLLINGKLTKFQYNLIRNSALEEGSTLYTNYEAVIKAKRMLSKKYFHNRNFSSGAFTGFT
ncbi:hypothetical protein AVEN_107505-1 [Araneus ventricosus]|uniref:Uncharacterized protein n=1 Tax=Araneus ventricosus TaxID=182803 RepID=A0A4Y2JPK0_ARAVE|nr:hypothetical protein AVEN_107505-1 [Araneus ventricosus]